MSKRTYKTYSKEFKVEAIRLAAESDRPVTQVARELGIHVGQIYNWRTQFNKLSKGQFTVADGTNYSVAEKVEIRKLKNEVAKLKEERDFLKKATAYFAKSDE